MVTSENDECRKSKYQKVTFEHKLFVIDQIKNGQIYLPLVDQFA